MAVAMLIGVLLACKLAKKRGIKSDDIYLLAVIVLPCAIVGARLYYCFFYDYNYNFWELFNTKQGGLALYGGVIGGIIGVIIYSFIKKDIKIVLTLFDVCAPCLLLGQAIGRWGNFFNQEAYGNFVSNTKLQWFPFSVWIENCWEKGCVCSGQGVAGWHYATFFYESLWNLIGVAILLLIYYKTSKTGYTTAMYFIWYGIGRSLIEGLRTDSLYIASTNIRVSQALSVVLVLIGVVILTVNLIRKRKSNG